MQKVQKLSESRRKGIATGFGRAEKEEGPEVEGEGHVIFLMTFRGSFVLTAPSALVDRGSSWVL